MDSLDTFFSLFVRLFYFPFLLHCLHFSYATQQCMRLIYIVAGCWYTFLLCSAPDPILDRFRFVIRIYKLTKSTELKGRIITNSRQNTENKKTGSQKYRKKYRKIQNSKYSRTQKIITKFKTHNLSLNLSLSLFLMYTLYGV